MSEKNYTITAADLRILGEAVSIIGAFLAKIHADSALAAFNAGAAIMALKKPEAVEKSMPTTQLQAVDQQAEAALDRLVHKHTVCKCKHGRTVATTCNGNCHTRKGTKKAEKMPTMRQLADELGVDYKTVKNFAYKNDLGIVRRGPRGNVTRELFPADVDAIRERFGNRS